MSMPRRILIFSLAYYPKFIGGAEIAIKEITDRIKAEDIEFHMITLRFDSSLPRESKEGKVYVHRIGWGKRGVSTAQTFTPLFYISKMLFVPIAFLKALTLHRRHRFDAAWAMMTYMLFPIVLMRLVGVRLPYALTLQEGDPFEHVFRRWYVLPFSPLLASGFKRAAVVQAISTYLGRWARHMGYRGPLEVIPNGADTGAFSRDYPPSELEQLHRQVKKTKATTLLITTSRLVQKNGIDDVIRALALLPKPYRFLILGEGPEEMKLKSLAFDTGVADRVQFLGRVEHRELPKYLKVADIFVRPSLSEGMGNSFIEAMAAGIPVIATQEGGIADFLFDPERDKDREPTGKAVAPRSPEEIAEAAKWLMGHETERRRIIDNARALATSSYDWNLIAGHMREKVFARLFKRL